MKNKKGFAISAILYSIIIIAVLVFFLVLAINRNTVSINKSFITGLKDQLNDNFENTYLPPHIAYEFDLSKGGSYVNIQDSDLLGSNVYVYQGKYDANRDKIIKNFENPYKIYNDLTYKTDLRSRLGNSGIYTVVATKFEKTGKDRPNIDIFDVKATDSNHPSKFPYNEGLIGIPYFDIRGLGTTSFDYLLVGAKNFNQDLSDWKTENITSMFATFYEAYNFNGDISTWSIGSVQSFGWMFWGTKNFNQSLNNWNMSNVSNIDLMFSKAEKFNGNISNWDTSNITSMRGLFWAAYDFNGNISNWNVKKVKHMDNMFLSARKFNQNISSWDVKMYIPTKPTDFDGDTLVSWNESMKPWHDAVPFIAYEFNLSLGSGYVNIQDSDLVGKTVYVYQGSYEDNRSKINYGFKTPYRTYTDLTYKVDLRSKLGNSGVYTVVATSFKKPGITAGQNGEWPETTTYKNNALIKVPHFDIKGLGTTSLATMFNEATTFNQNIEHWDISNIEDITYIFRHALSFNQPLNKWNTSKVKYMRGILQRTPFNYPLNGWNVSNVEDMDYIFNYTFNFNQPLNNWNVSKVKKMKGAFYYAEVFNQDISNWNVKTNIPTKPDMFDNGTLSAWNSSKKPW